MSGPGTGSLAYLKDGYLNVAVRLNLSPAAAGATRDGCPGTSEHCHGSIAARFMTPVACGRATCLRPWPSSDWCDTRSEGPELRGHLAHNAAVCRVEQWSDDSLRNQYL